MIEMIDTWLLAAFCLSLLMLGALVRVVRIKNRNDRHLAAMVAITIGSSAGLTLSVALGTVLILDLTIILALLGFAGIIALAKFSGGAPA
jgi:multisubunit Na+/H+ antiporter MnhF subunit